MHVCDCASTRLTLGCRLVDSNIRTYCMNTVTNCFRNIDEFIHATIHREMLTVNRANVSSIKCSAILKLQYIQYKIAVYLVYYTESLILVKGHVHKMTVLVQHSFSNYCLLFS